MCGLVGIAGKIGPDEKAAFETLLKLDVVRGEHSTGIFYRQSFGDKHAIVKEVGTPWHGLLQSDGYKDINWFHVKVLMGHNRAATIGEVNKDNAHPFEHGNIIGAHNGTLRNQRLLDDHEMFDVDSDNLFYHMSTNGIAHTVSNLHGAYALSWYDLEDDSINFVRNDDRPLTYALVNGGKTIVWASESWMIFVACGKRNIKVDEVLNFELHTHYKLNITGFGINVKVEKPRTKVLKPYEPPPVVYFNYKKYEGQNQGGTATVAKKRQVNPKVEGLKVGQTISYRYLGASFVGKGLGKDYLRGVETVTDCNVRLFPIKHSKQWDDFSQFQGVYTGTIKKVCGYPDPHVVVKLNSVRKVEEAEFEEVDENDELEYVEPLYSVHGGRAVNLLTYQGLTKHGCVGCGDPIDPMHDDTITWVGEDRPVCEGCMKSKQFKTLH